MTQPTPEAQSDFESEPADEQETLRLDGADRADPDATRPMSLADLLDSD
jgi:hypothetical protein